MATRAARQLRRAQDGDSPDYQPTQSNVREVSDPPSVDSGRAPKPVRGGTAQCVSTSNFFEGRAQYAISEEVRSRGGRRRRGLSSRVVARLGRDTACVARVA